MTGDDHPAPFDDAAPIRAGVFKHMPKVDLRKAAIGHALQQVRAEIELPAPPEGPLTLRQRSHPAFVHRIHLWALAQGGTTRS